MSTSSSLRALGVLAAGAIAAMPACSTRGAAVQAPVDVVVQPAAGAVPLMTNSGAVDSSPHGCTVRLVAAPIEKSSSGCYLDEKISEGPGLLQYPCSGDGAAEAVFGEHRYVGRIDHGDVQVELTTELDWEDQCRWGTRATISGSVGGSATGTATGTGTGTGKGKARLAWRYLDHVISGTNCSGVCRATSTLTVTDTTSPIRGREAPGDVDDAD